MLTCQICLHKYKELRFNSARISVCGRCVNSLNKSPEVAEHAEARLGELLLHGMERRSRMDLTSTEPWRRQRAKWTLENLLSAHADALSRWLNNLLAAPKNSTKDFKILRAHRRGLLHYDRPKGWGYPASWKDVASRIRRLDHNKCVACKANDRVIDVHHIVYVSNFGTHQQSNLVALCRPCHEAEHKRVFDFGEQSQENLSLSDSDELEVQPGTANINTDPEFLMAGITLAIFHIESGARTFSAYSRAMIDDLGDLVKPYLKSWYMVVKYGPHATDLPGMSSTAEIEATDVGALKPKADDRAN